VYFVLAGDEWAFLDEGAVHADMEQAYALLKRSEARWGSAWLRYATVA
jgi:hypothetical protein